MRYNMRNHILVLLKRLEYGFLLLNLRLVSKEMQISANS